jgi:glycerate kinase
VRAVATFEASGERVAQLEEGFWWPGQGGQGRDGRSMRPNPDAGVVAGVEQAALAFLRATSLPKTELMVEMIGFSSLLDDARLVLTGERSLDEQSLRGKAPEDVACAAVDLDVPTIAVLGRTPLSTSELPRLVSAT